MISILSCSILATSLIIAGVAQADTGETLTAPKKGLVDYDQHILGKIHAANQSEIKMGKLALEKSKSGDVRAFGQRLIDDHSKADDDVSKVANNEHVLLTNPPLAINDQEKADQMDEKNTMDRLSSLEGAAFDRAFRQAMIDDHKKDIKDLSDALPKLKDSETREVVAKILPVIKKHEKIAAHLKKDESANYAG